MHIFDNFRGIIGDFSMDMIGDVMATFGAFSIVGAVVGGRISDRFGRVIVMGIAVGSLTVAFIVMV